MKRFTFCMVVFAATALVGTVWAGKDKEEAQLRLDLDLVDGSHITGTPGIETVPVQTSYAKMDIPLKQILAIKIAEDHETASIDLQNGDKLKGVVNLEPIKLETVFGKVAIGIQHIRGLRVVPSGGTLPDVLRKGLVLYYSFDRDENGKVTDLSGGNNRGTVMEGTKWVREGRHSGGYRMPGGRGRIEVDDSPVFSMKTDDNRTFCLWWKKDGNIQHKVLLSKWSQANDGLGFSLLTLISDRQYYMALQRDHWARFAAALSEDAWNHVAVVKAGTACKVYHNGQEARLAASMGWPLTVDMTVKTPLEIGGTHMADFGFEGLVDEVMVFDRALSGEEVKQIYDLQK